MTDVTENQSQNEEVDLDEMTPEQREQAEKDMLRSRLKVMGVSYSNNAGVEALREKVRAAMEGSTPETAEVEQDEQEAVDTTAAPMPTASPARKEPEVAQAAPAVKPVSEMTKLELRNHLRKEQLKLVRCRITNLDPKKKDWPGEVITFANSFVGTVSRFVPFGETTDEGWHIEYCLYQLMKDRQFLDISTKKVKGQIVVKHRLVREFSLDVMEPLTKEELRSLGQAQLAAGTSSLNQD